MSLLTQASARSLYTWVLYLLFFLSGATGLIYEIMWNRKLTLIFGSTVYSVTTILTVFFAGLALGAYLIGRRVDHVRSPLYLYIGLEFAIGLFGFASPLLFDAIDWSHSLLYPFLGDTPVRLTALRFALSFIALLIPTTLLGATLPVLVKLVTKNDAGVAESAGRLYAVNSLGAALGTLLAATSLIPLLGVNGSLYLAGFINIAIAVFAWLVFKKEAREKAAQQPTARYFHNGVQKYILTLFGVAGFISMAYQVAWFRLLIQITGTSVYTFGLMLSIFIAGVGLGSAALTRLLPKIRSAVGMLVLVEILASVYSLLSVSYFDSLPAFYVSLSLGLAGFSSEVFSPFFLELMSKAFIATIVFLIPTLMFGAAFPLVATVFAQRSADSGRDVGIVYAVNTVGGVLGSFLGGFFFLPMLGTQVTIAVMGVAGVLLAVAIAMPLAERGMRIAAPVGGVVLVVLSTLIYSPWNPLLIDAGPYWLRYPNAASMIESQMSKHLHYYREGVNVNVSVTGSPTEPDTITINGKPMASTLLTDVANQYLLGHLPMLLHPNPQDSMVIGLGAGMTFGALLRHGGPTDVIEISPEVVEGARRFSRYNRSALDQPNANIIFDDGRNYLITTTKKYDVITEDPLDPFFMGSGYLYDIEHFENARRALKPGGIMCQYLPLYQLGLEESRIIVKTFNQVFSHVTAWFAFNDILLIGSEEPIAVDYELLRERVRRPDIARDLSEIGIDNEFDFLANYMFDETLIPEIGSGLPLNTDDYPIIEFLAPRSILRNTENENLIYYLDRRILEAPDLIDTSNLSMERAADIEKRFDQYFEARAHIMKAHVGTLGENYPWLVEARAAAQVTAPHPIASHYLAEIHRLAGRLAFEQEQYELALEEYQRSLTLLPDDLEALNAAGFLFWEDGQRQKALSLFKLSFEIDGDQIYPLPFLAEDSIDRGQLTEAAAYIDTCFSLDPNYAPCSEIRDVAQQALGAN